jgi:hypothetical protein
MPISHPTIPIPITYSLAHEQICDPEYAGRKTFSSGVIKLTVPSYLEDDFIRYMLNFGKSLEKAYQEAEASSIYPDPACRACVRREILQSKYYDVMSQDWKHVGGNYTCMIYFRCFEEYLNAFRDFPIQDDVDRLMRLAPGVYVPSPRQKACIVSEFTRSGDLYSAYRNCGAIDFYPWWPGGAAFVSATLRNSPHINLYDSIKDSYIMATLYPGQETLPSRITPMTEPPPVTELPPYTQIPGSPAKAEAEPISPTFKWIVGAVSLISLLLLLKR